MTSVVPDPVRTAQSGTPSPTPAPSPARSGRTGPGRAFLTRTALTRTALVVLVCAAAGALSALLIPRGPQRPVDVVWSVVIAVAVGGFAGWVLRSRWAILLGPLCFAVGVEAARVDVVGPSVDRPRLTVAVGVIVFVLGRVFHGLVVLAPMAVAAAYGAALARRGTGAVGGGAAARDTGVRRRPYLRYARTGLTAVIALALLALGVVLTRPGSTAPILAADGKPLPGSVAELATVELGGHEQTVLIRARSADAPVLLYLAGGPGQSDFGYTRAYMPTMEEHFVFAVWDQRGTGTSYDALDPTDTWTLEQAVADTVELTNQLRERFDERKIYLFGNSWGSTLGVLAAQRHPELYHAYIGSGQMVSQLESDRIIYRDMLDYAARTGDDALADKLLAWGEPPYADLYAYANQIEYYDKIGPYEKTEWFTSRRPAGLDGNGVDEYGPLDKVNKLKALFDMAAVMYPRLQEVDFRRDVPSLAVPVYLVQGGHELRGRLEPARQWYGALAAPHKEWITFEESGHIPQFEEYPRFERLLTDIIVPRTYPT